MEEYQKIELFDDAGNAFEVEHLLTFEHENVHYIAFGDIMEDDDAEAGVYIFRIEEKDGEDDTYIPIENPVELEEAWSIFKDIFFEEDEDEE
jgi:uncharacterized protein YrzB (UPF0473 family)